MQGFTIESTRRRFTVRLVEMVGAAMLIGVAGMSSRAIAKAAKREFMYQDHQHDGKSCAQCKYFSPDNANPNVGACEIVDGTISRDGWCMAFAAKT